MKASIILTIYIISIILLLIYFYILSVNTQKYIKVKEKLKYCIKFRDLDNNYYENNSSVIKLGERYIVYTRISNYSDITYPIIRGFYWFYINVLKLDKFYNLLGVTEYDYNFNIISQKIEKPNIKNDKLSIEDLRAFIMNDNIYLMGIASDHSLKKFWPVILFNDYSIYDILDMNNNRYYGDKNLVFINNSKLIIKNHNPLEILKIEDVYSKSVITSTYFKGKYEKNKPNFRGSSNYLNIGGDRYIGIVHSVDYKIIGRDYMHYFLILNVGDNENVYIERISKPLCFSGNCGVEFVMGLEESLDAKNYVVTLGKNDSSSYIILVSKETVFSYFT